MVFISKILVSFIGMLIAYISMVKLITNVSPGTSLFALLIPVGGIVLLQSTSTILLVVTVFEKLRKIDRMNNRS